MDGDLGVEAGLMRGAADTEPTETSSIPLGVSGLEDAFNMGYRFFNLYMEGLEEMDKRRRLSDNEKNSYDTEL